MRNYIRMLYEATTALCDPYPSQGSITIGKAHPLHNVISKAIEQLYEMPSSEVVNTGLLLWCLFQKITNRYSGKPHWDDPFFSALLRPFVMRQPLDSSIQCLQLHLSLATLTFRSDQNWRKGRCIMQFFISQMTALAVRHKPSKGLDPPEIQSISALGELWHKTDNNRFGFRKKFVPVEMVYLRWEYAFPFTILTCLPEEMGRQILQRVWNKKVQTENNRNWRSLFEEVVKGQWDSFFNELRKSHFRSCQFLMLISVDEDGKTLDPDFRRVMVEVYPDRPVDYYDQPYDFAIEKKTSRLLKRYYQEHILVHDSSYPPNLVLDPREENVFIISPFDHADFIQPFRWNEVDWGLSRSASIIDMRQSPTWGTAL
jgi:hypothetical protein